MQTMTFLEDDEPPSRGQAAQPAAIPVSTRPLPPPSAPVAPAARAPRRVAPPASPRLVISPRSREFKRRFFPEASNADWNNWQWQSRNRLRDLRTLERVFTLSVDERDTITRHRDSLPVGITPYYSTLIDREDPLQGLRRTVMPTSGEFLAGPGEADDPLGEEHDSAVPGLIHRYPDRALFLVNKFCSVYCRYCTRARLVGETAGEYTFSTQQWDRALQYIEATPTIRDVLISGGDPLTLADDKLDYLLGRLRKVPHLEFVRIGTKVPAVLPQRITPALVRILRRHRPVWLSVHFTHPDEVTPEVAEACGRLADAGMPLGSQTVLLKGVNDEVPIMRNLVHNLLKVRVRPYYLYQCDPISGSAHFRTSVQKGIDIIEGLRGHTTGYAVPHYVIDAPGGGGKIPLLPEYVVGREGDDLLLTNFEGGVYRYPDPGGTLGTGRGRTN